ncbi:polysaccharide deacetylase family protein [Coraliomargarita algicola]|uniref:Polysaccharide deacetylase family protein n=1 Tax=Coraliomargarita algicola TaxID=3092156 RepID=A0ABZ0RMV2_9BACT|nr:polysaccharide deacetylase family protein [Coraliomargarita sp. J2-16]WPJ96753.1 polysaccharide deacetylase family protein [Coraliomargarita sp. J2-16]
MASPELETLPLPKGANWAISTRWDDGPQADIKMADLLEKHGFKGSFYVMTGRKPNTFERDLLTRGHTVQSHSITHSRLSCIAPAQTWREMLLPRIDLECRLDRPVNCFAYPSNSQASAFDPDARGRLYQMLLRAGYHHVPVRRNEKDSEISGANVLPADGNPVDEAFQKFYSDPDLQAFEPNITWAYHANTHARKNTWELLGKQLEAHAHLEDAWYCRQDEYAAYRIQFTRAHLSPIGAEAFSLLRPGPALAGAEVPLELRLNGSPGQVAPVVKVDGRPVELIPLPLGGWRFAVPWPEEEGVPRLIGAEDFPWLKGTLAVSGDQKTLSFQMENAGAESIREVRMTWRLPPLFNAGKEWQVIGDLASSGVWSEEITLAPQPTGYNQLGGALPLAVQVDFRLEDGTFGRVYFLTEETFNTPDGPENHLQDHVVLAVKEGDLGFEPATLSHPDGGRCPGPGIALLTELESNGTKTVEFKARGLQEILLNGDRVENGHLDLRPGTNTLRLLPAKHDFWFSLTPPELAKFKRP